MLSYYHTIAFDLDLGFELEREFNLQTFLMAWEEEDEEEEEEDNKNESNYLLLLGLICSSRESHTPTLKRKRRKKRNEIKYVEDDGTISILTPIKTFWYQYYIQNGPTLSAAMGIEKFQNCYRITFNLFGLLLEDLVESPIFSR